MPIPNPKSGEKKETFINRCMGDDVMVKDYDDVKQRYAICIGSWLDKFSNNIGKFWYKKRLENFSETVQTIRLQLRKEIISIDFDDTLSTPKGQELAQQLIKQGKDVHIVTRRRPNMNQEVEKVARMVGIPFTKIHYTSGEMKWKTLQRLGITKHYDNNDEEIRTIKEHTPDIIPVKFAEIGERGGIKETPKAPKSDTPNPNPKKGSDVNKPGAASTGRGVEVPENVMESLQKKSDEFNERYKEKLGYGVNVGMLKSVYQRGVGAFQTSHSPKVRSAEQWAQARVNAFLYLIKEGRPENPKYVGDYDLLPEKHPKKT